ncbi:MAG TPA: site-2 protease family protein [Thermoanaerobaculia bacterium]|jgi:regulator of sigma E protease|nr:site-2 protease family protein [Thermoanaerobaculia bacterium]
MSYLGVILLLGLLILIHEAGHLAAAKWTGIPIEGFSVGFGPKVWARRWGLTEYSLRAFPLGGFVVPAVEEDEFRAIALRKRLAFFVSGSLANLAATVPLFALLNGGAEGFSFYGSFIAPFRQVGVTCLQFLSFLPSLMTHPKALSGVVGIVVEGGQAVHAGRTLELAISLTLSLGVLNLLPIPILDGGQILLSILEEIFPRAIKLRAPLTVLGMVALVGLMILANVHDTIRYWG